MRNLYLRSSFLLLLLFVFANLKGKAQSLDWPEAEEFGVLAGGKIYSTDPAMIIGSAGSAGSIDNTVQPTGNFYDYNNGNVNPSLSILQDNINACWSFGGTAINNILTGQVLQPGVYQINSSAVFEAGATLELQGDYNSVFIFNIDGDLNIESAASMIVGDIRPENVYWNVNGHIYIQDQAVAFGVYMSSRDIEKTGVNYGKAAFLALHNVSILSNISPTIGHNQYYSIKEMKAGPGAPNPPISPCSVPGTPTNANPNLIVNSSFEEQNPGTCPHGWSTMDSPDLFVCHWRNISKSLATPDYFNSCAPASSLFVPTNSVPTNFGGSNHPAHILPGNTTGDAYAGIIGYAKSYGNSREYVRQNLPTGRHLNGGRTYYGEFYVSCAEYSPYAISNLAMYVTSALPESGLSNTFVIPAPLPTIIQHTGPVITSTGWTQIAGTFQAAGGEKYVTIGNFKDDNHTSVDTTNRPTISYVNNHGYYYIDDVALYELPYAGENTSVCSGDNITLGSGFELPSHVGANYQWLINGIQIQPNGNMLHPTVTPTQTTTYTLIVRINGSIKEITNVTITVKPGVIAGSDFTICAHDSKLLTSGQPAGGIWSGTGVTYTNGMYSFSSPTNAAGTYTLTYTLNGCSKTLVATVEPATSPIVTINANYPACGRQLAPSASITNPQAGHTYSMDLTDAAGTPLVLGVVINNPAYFGLPLNGPGVYTLKVTDNQALAPCNTTTITFITGGVKWLGSPGVVTTIDAALTGGIVNFGGEYLVKGPLELVKGTFNFAPGTYFHIDPQNGVAASTMGLHTFAPYLTQNGGTTNPTIIKAGDRAILNLNGVTLTALSCYTQERWGGLHLTDGAIINTNEGLDPVTGSILKTTISKALIGIGSSQLVGTVSTVNNNRYKLTNTKFENNVFGFRDLAKQNPSLASEGIINCSFTNNETGVYLEEDPDTGSLLPGGNYSLSVYKDNNFDFNGTGFKGAANQLILETNIFNYNNIGTELSGSGSAIQFNTFNLVDNGIGIDKAMNMRINNNTIYGTTLRQAKGILMSLSSTAENNLLKDLGIGIEIGTNIYNYTKVEKNTFLDNLVGIRFTPPTPGNTYGSSAPPTIACNTFSAGGIINSNTVGISIPQWVYMVHPNYTSANNPNRLGGPNLFNFPDMPSGNYFEQSIDVPIVNQSNSQLNYYVFKQPNTMDLDPGNVFLANVTIVPTGVDVLRSPCRSGTNPPGVLNRTVRNVVSPLIAKEPEISGFLGQNFPNPAMNETNLAYKLPIMSKSANIIIREIMTGKVVETFELKPTILEGDINVNLQKYKNGVYAYSLIINGKISGTKLMLVEK